MVAVSESLDVVVAKVARKESRIVVSKCFVIIAGCLERVHVSTLQDRPVDANCKVHGRHGQNLI